MKIYVTRHGQTDYNKKRMMQGRSDIPLNEVGIAQATARRKALTGRQRNRKRRKRQKRDLVLSLKSSHLRIRRYIIKP